MHRSDHLLQWSRLSILHHNLLALRHILTLIPTPISCDHAITQSLHECVLRNFDAGLMYLLDECKLDVNYRAPHGKHVSWVAWEAEQDFMRGTCMSRRHVVHMMD